MGLSDTERQALKEEIRIRQKIEEIKRIEEEKLSKKKKKKQVFGLETKLADPTSELTPKEESILESELKRPTDIYGDREMMRRHFLDEGLWKAGSEGVRIPKLNTFGR